MTTFQQSPYIQQMNRFRERQGLPPLMESENTDKFDGKIGSANIGYKGKRIGCLGKVKLGINSNTNSVSLEQSDDITWLNLSAAVLGTAPRIAEILADRIKFSAGDFEVVFFPD